MVLGELGRMRIEHLIDIKMLNYWFRIICGDQSKLSNIFYKLLYNMSESGVYQATWIKAIKVRLIKYNLYHYWETQDLMDMSKFVQFKKNCKSSIKEYYRKDWVRSVKESRKCYLYKGFKTDLNMEKYLISLPEDLRICMSKFRLCNHKLPIEVGRHNNIERNIRFCTLCNKKDLGDEYHYLFVCDHFKQIRRKFMPLICCKKPSVQKFCDLLSTLSIKTLLKIARFCRIIMSNFK
jgi:hypothetical protein